jgi:homogentisate 1,2-dioxygenase
MQTAENTKKHSQAASGPLEELHYQSGFANEFATETLEGAIPVGAEFTAARAVWAICGAVVGYRVHCAPQR